MPKLSGNKGEWSEIYAFLRLLEKGKLYAADENLNRKDNVFYNIINIIRDENIGILEFRVDRQLQEISVYNTASDSEILRLPIAEFRREADYLYKEIVSASSSAFSVPQTELFLDQISVKTLKAKSTDKADIRIKIHDIDTGYEAVQGFSIKSRLGGAATLINAGKTTNFIYEIKGNITDPVMNKFNTFTKFKEKFEYLTGTGCSIEYCQMENEVFEDNLCLIDGDLPEICAKMLEKFYSSKLTEVKEILDYIANINPMNYRQKNGQPFYTYKFKKFLTDSALGMLPSKPWDGTTDATGGYIIVCEDGDVLCYHLFNRNEFENYLINNTKFETASTTRHGFGNIYEENGKYYLKLNLQIRFIK